MINFNAQNFRMWTISVINICIYTKLLFLSFACLDCVCRNEDYLKNYQGLLYQDFVLYIFCNFAWAEENHSLF